MTKIYLAGPLFTLAERGFNVELARFLESEGFEVWLPQEHEPRSKTAKSIFDMDVAALDWADMVVACMDGPDPDSGTAWECGYAYAKGKPIVCFRTDFRVSGDTKGAPYNLMLTESATARFETPFRTRLRNSISASLRTSGKLCGRGGARAAVRSMCRRSAPRRIGAGGGHVTRPRYRWRGSSALAVRPAKRRYP